MNPLVDKRRGEFKSPEGKQISFGGRVPVGGEFF